MEPRIDNDNQQQGVALVELLILLPLLLLFVLGGLEYSQTLERSQWVSQLSREVANVAYRNCTANRGAALGACLRRDVLTPLSSVVDVLAPGSQFIVAVYRYEGGNVIEERIEGGASYMGRFRAMGFSATTLQLQANQNKLGTPGRAVKEAGLIVVGSAFSPMRGIARSVAPGMTLVFPDVIYSTTVM